MAIMNKQAEPLQPTQHSRYPTREEQAANILVALQEIRNRLDAIDARQFAMEQPLKQLAEFATVLEAFGQSPMGRMFAKQAGVDK